MTAPRLNQLYFYLTEGCNLACRHCWLAPKFDGDGRSLSNLPLDLFETAISEAIPLGLTGVKLTGGEPLLHPGIIDLLKIVRRKELRLAIETNGLLCTSQIAAEIAKSPRPFVSVSIDGADAATHEAIRGVSGSFDAACQAVRHLVAVGVRPQIIMSVMRANVEQVEAVVRMAEGLGAASLKFNPVQPTARGEKMHKSGQTVGLSELVSIGRRVDMELSATTSMDLFFDYPLAFRPLSCIARGDSSGVCGILGILGVIPDKGNPSSGNYALCGIGGQIADLVFGVVGRDPLKTVWQKNTILNQIRDGLPDRLGSPCAECLMKPRCLGACIAQNYYRTGSLWAPFWFCEEAMKAGLFPKSRQAVLQKEQA